MEACWMISVMDRQTEELGDQTDSVTTLGSVSVQMVGKWLVSGWVGGALSFYFSHHCVGIKSRN